MDHPWSPLESRPELLFRVQSQASRTHQRIRVGFVATEEKKLYNATDLVAFCQSIIDHRTQEPKKSPYISLFENFAEADMWAVALEDVTGRPASIYAIDVFHPTLQSASIFKVSHVEQICKLRLGTGATSEWLVCHRLATAAIIESMTRTSTEVRLEYGIPDPAPPFYNHRDALPVLHTPLGLDKVRLQTKNLLPCGCIHEDFCKHFQWPGATRVWAPNRGQLVESIPSAACTGPQTKLNSYIPQNVNQSQQSRRMNVPHYGPFPPSVEGFENLAKTRVHCSPQLTTSNPNIAPEEAQISTRGTIATPASDVPRGICAKNVSFRGGQNGTPPRKEILFPGHGRTSPSQPIHPSTSRPLHTGFNSDRKLLVGNATNPSSRSGPYFSVRNEPSETDVVSELVYPPLPGTVSPNTSRSSLLGGPYHPYKSPSDFDFRIPPLKVRQGPAQNGSQDSAVKSTSATHAHHTTNTQLETSYVKPIASLASTSKITSLASSRAIMDARHALRFARQIEPSSTLPGALNQPHRPHSIYAAHQASLTNTNQVPNNIIESPLRDMALHISKGDAPTPAAARQQVAPHDSSRVVSHLKRYGSPTTTNSVSSSSSLIVPQTTLLSYLSSEETLALNSSSSAVASSSKMSRIPMNLEEEDIIFLTSLSQSENLAPIKSLTPVVEEDEDTEMIDIATQELLEDYTDCGIFPDLDYAMKESDKQTLPKLIHKMKDTNTLEDLMHVLKRVN